jgi:hypothetical protein
LKAPCLRASAPTTSGGRAISAWRKPNQQSTPLGITALPTGTITVTNPAHPLYQRTLPLVGITNKPRLGQVCVVWLYAGVERVVPIGATNLSSGQVPPSRCRLSVGSVQELLTVVASLAISSQEEAYVDTNSQSTTNSPTLLSTGPAGLVVGPAQPTAPASDAFDGAAPTSVGRFIAGEPAADSADDGAHYPGGAQ